MSSETNVKLRLNNSELWGGLIGLALGGFVIWSGLKLKLGTINDPGAGFDWALLRRNLGWSAAWFPQGSC